MTDQTILTKVLTDPEKTSTEISVAINNNISTNIVQGYKALKETITGTTNKKTGTPSREILTTNQQITSQGEQWEKSRITKRETK